MLVSVATEQTLLLILAADKMDPAATHKECVRWQRGPLKETPMELMKSVNWRYIPITLIFRPVSNATDVT